MKRIAQAVGLAGVLFAAAPAMAADLGAPPPLPYQAGPFAAPLYNWTGFYVGVHAGAGWSSATAKDQIGGVFAPAGSGSGFLGGGQLGYNYQSGPWVFGIEGDFSYTDTHGTTVSTLVAPNVGLTTRLNWLGTATGRLGYAWDGTLLYAKAGAAFGNLNFDVTTSVAVFDSKDTRTGWTVGAGVEHALWDNWTVKAEYDYLDLGTRTVTATAPTGAAALADAKVAEHMIKLGANYKFSWH